MGIQFDAAARTFTLSTRSTTYQMGLDHLDRLLHLYYGPAIGQGDLAAMYPPADRGFSPNHNADRERRGISPDVLPQEYTGCNTGDFRLSCLVVREENGAAGAEWHYASHSIQKGKYALTGLPAAHDEENEAESLCIRMEDSVTGLALELLYGVFEAQDIITRAARLVNGGKQTLRLEKAASMCLDLPFGRWDMIHFHGRHAMERRMERTPLMNAIQTVSSTRGASSHHHNPFVILCDRKATEEHGLCYGVMPVYSGSHRTDVEVDQNGLTRIVSGIHDERFSWQLAPGEAFTAPEVILACTENGLTALSQQYHRFIRHNVCRGEFRFARRPVLINNWEATYFDFDSDAIVRIAEKAAALGVEMLVLDDGWFGKRNDDNSGLGDWFVNEEKLPGGLAPLAKRIGDLGLAFGLWVEPEMVNENSDLYRAHPDWALAVPGKAPALGRDQLVLDFSRAEVRKNIFDQLCAVLDQGNIEYLKWDFNRSIVDIYSHATADQGRVVYDYYLGLYDVLERLVQRYPHLLIEGCAAGGGRFDAGWFHYAPQFWTSDNTDGHDRMTIQYGSSFGYPCSVMGAHVSACPNEVNGRTVSLSARGLIAMSGGGFGYELDLLELPERACEIIRNQVQQFRDMERLVREGLYYRLSNPMTDDVYMWEFAAEDGSEAIVNSVIAKAEGYGEARYVVPRGLTPGALYREVNSDRVYAAICARLARDSQFLSDVLDEARLTALFEQDGPPKVISFGE